MFPFPKDFLNSLRSIPHFKEEKFVKVHEIQMIPVSIRNNPFKEIHKVFVLGKQIPWAVNAYYLLERPQFTADPLFHAGCYYVQEASSMFVEFVLKQLIDFKAELRVLDLCAAPGGKTTILSSLLSSESLLVANEVVSHRADILAYNLAKWGQCNHVVTSNETNSFSTLKNMFDLVLVDAPCSGSGLFRKQADAVHEWSKDAVLQCSDRQQNILKGVLPAVKAGGIFVYSTCSYSVLENEENVSWLLKQGDLELVKLAVPPEWGVEDTGLGYRFYPYNLEGEGFFCAVFRKTGDHGSFRMSQKNEFKEITKIEKTVVEKFVKFNSELHVLNHEKHLKLLNTKSLEFINNTKKTLYLKQVGTSLGEIMHQELIPHHFLALSNHINTEIEIIELTENEAVKYLKKEIFCCDTSSKGLKLVTHKAFGIGWAKILNNRVNNYLPLNWMIFDKQIGISK